MTNRQYSDGLLTLALCGITQMEAAGQQSLLNSSKLPIDGSLGNRTKLESLGFTFGEVLDDLFISATMPEGWHLEPNGSMHSTLLDAQGVARGNVFYKAAPYDRQARLSLYSAD